MAASKIRPVIAVIPHYNMPETLLPLLQQIIKERYDGVYVLDDHSTVCDIVALLAPFGAAVHLIRGSKNVGAAGNRNRILAVQELQGAILHFIDADCELLTQNIPDVARRLLADPTIGAISGLICNPDGQQMEFNYYSRFSVSAALSGMLMMATIASGYTNPQKKKRMPKVLRRLLSDYPNPHEAPVAKTVFGVPEGNMLISYDTFASIGGFDPSLRFAEGQDLGFKLAAKKLAVRFDPVFAVKHHFVLLPDRKRLRYMMQGNSRLARKYGLRLR